MANALVARLTKTSMSCRNPDSINASGNILAVNSRSTGVQVSWSLTDQNALLISKCELLPLRMNRSVQISDAPFGANAVMLVDRTWTILCTVSEGFALENFSLRLSPQTIFSLSASNSEGGEVPKVSLSALLVCCIQC
jgi:hypothetical protein